MKDTLIVRILLVVSLIGLWGAVHSAPAFACSCPVPRDYTPPPIEERVEEWLAYHPEVFRARALSIHRWPLTPDDIGRWTYELEVNTVWKGIVAKTTYIPSDVACVYHFDLGHEYIVFVDPSGRVGGCGPTTEIKHGTKMLWALGTGTPPTSPLAARPGASAKSPALSSIHTSAGAAVAAMVEFVFAVFAWVRGL